MKKRKALLVIDMLRDFLDADGVLYCGHRARRIIPYVAKKVEEFHKRKDPVIFVCDRHHPGDYELRIYPPHAMTGSRGAELVDGIHRGPGDIVIAKRFYSGFTNPKLVRTLNKLRINEAYVTGVCTSICVMENVARLFYMKIPVFIYKRGVADFNETYHEFALSRMKKIFGARLIN